MNLKLLFVLAAVVFAYYWWSQNNNGTIGGTIGSTNVVGKESNVITNDISQAARKVKNAR